MMTLTYADALYRFKKSDYNQNPSLTDAVIAQLNNETGVVAQNMMDIVAYGINGGFGGFIYYTDTIAFAKANRNDIKAVAKELADNLGADGAMSVFAQLKCCKDNDLTIDAVSELFYNPDDDQLEAHTSFWNCLAWYAGEEVSRWFNNFVECENIKLVEEDEVDV